MTDYFDDLPSDPEAAFVFLEARFRTDLEKQFENGNSNDFDVQTYISQTLGAADALGIEALSAYQGIAIEQIEYAPFQHSVTKLITQLHIRNSVNRRTLSAGFSEEQKTKLHALIEKIRSEVDQSDAQQDKKDKIFNILSVLAKEVSKDRTGFGRFADLARALAGLSKEVEREGAQPWWKWYKLAMGIVDDAKEKEPALPSPEEPKRIEPPRKQLEKPKSRDLDDEIPF